MAIRDAKCSKCKFWDTEGTIGGIEFPLKNGFGLCRIDPPHLNPLITHENDWCGRFEENKEEIP